MQTRTLEKRITAPGRAAILAVTMLVTGCGDEPPPQDPVDGSTPLVDASTPPVDGSTPFVDGSMPLVDGSTPPVDAAGPDAGPNEFAVRGSATGVLGPVDMELQIDGDSETLTVTQAGAFAFDARLESGTSYTVTLVDPAMPCTLRNQTGVIAGADAAVELTCTVPALASVAVSGIAPAVTLAPDRTDYVVELPLLQSAVTLTATVATAGDTLTIAGADVPSSTPSQALALNLGDNDVDIVVENHVGWQRAYRLNLRRAARLAQYAYGKASNTGDFDLFGRSVALSGDTLVVAAVNEDSAAQGVNGDQSDDTAVDSGAVYVFRRNGTTWQQEAYLKASNTGADDRFGSSVALSGDTIAVTAQREDSAAQGVNGDQNDNTAVDSGAVYVFRRTGSTWQQEAYLKASNTAVRDELGASVALSGDVLAVGATLEDSAAQGVGGNQDNNGALSSGAVYVFRRTGSTWQQEAYVKASNTDTQDSFGSSVALDDDTLAVAAFAESSGAQGVNGDQDDDSVPGSGAVYVFRHTGTIWQQEAYIKASNPGVIDHFGDGVALSGDTLAVGASAEDSAAQGVGGDQANDDASDSGAVYVFRRTGTQWQQEGYLKASNTDENDFFGRSVALTGDTLAVGAFGEDSAAQGVDGNQADDTAATSGAVYLFRRTGTAWQQTAYVKASNTGANDSLGFGLALSDDTLAAGALFEDSAAQGVGGNQASDAVSNSGAVYVFH
jgi:hypothetical protein